MSNPSGRRFVISSILVFLSSSFAAIAGRSHITVWYDMAEREEETSRAIVEFVERTLKAGAD